MGEIKKTSTPYDDVFRTLLNDCTSLIIPVINEIFGENYTGREEIVFSANEHFLNQQGENEDKRTTDSSFKIIGKETKKYHWECQSSTDSSMLVRLFEYDTQIALDEGEIEGNILTVTFPHTAVLFLRCNSSTPDTMKIRMITPGSNAIYDIPVMKSKQYTLEEIFEKKLLFLIPFYIFSYEDRFIEYEQDEKRLEALEQEYEQMKKRLEELQNQGEINEYMRRTIIDMSNKVVEHIAWKFKRIREGVQSVMGGKVLEHEAKTIRNEGIKLGIQTGLRQGRAEGIEEGREKGREEGIRGTVSVLKSLGIEPQIILAKIQEQYNLSLEISKKYL